MKKTRSKHTNAPCPLAIASNSRSLSAAFTLDLHAIALFLRSNLTLHLLSFWLLGAHVQFA